MRIESRWKVKRQRMATRSPSLYGSPMALSDRSAEFVWPSRSTIFVCDRSEVFRYRCRGHVARMSELTTFPPFPLLPFPPHLHSRISSPYS